MNILIQKAALLSLALAVLPLASPAQAAIQTLVGPNVTYQYDDALVGLFGLPSLSGNSLIFTPTNFKAQSHNGAGIASATGTIHVKIFANAGFLFPSISVHEKGDYYLIGSDAQVAVGGQIRAFSLSNPHAPHVTDPIVATAPLTVTTSLSSFSTTNWEANATVNTPTSWSTDGVNLTIENILLAYTASPGSSAFIEKKFVGTAIVITPIPEADTYAMMLAGLGLIGWMTRRRYSTRTFH